MAIMCSLAVATIAGLSILIFSLNKSWVQARVAAVLVMFTVAIMLLEYGGNGRWFPLLSPLKGRLRSFTRILAFAWGLALLLFAIGFCWACGAGNVKYTTVGFILGVYTSSFIFIRYSVSGRWVVATPSV